MAADITMVTDSGVSIDDACVSDNGQVTFSESFVSLQDCASVVQPLSEEPPRGHSESLLRSVHGLLCSRDLLDVVIQCMDGICSAHRLVLAAFSPMLQVLLVQGANIGQDRTIHVVLDEVRHCDLQVLINFMYTGCLLVSDVSPALYEAAQQLGMLDVIKRALGDVTCQNTNDDDEKQISSLPEDLQQSGSKTNTYSCVVEESNPEKMSGSEPVAKLEMERESNCDSRNENNKVVVDGSSKQEENVVTQAPVNTPVIECDSSVSERTRHRTKRRPNLAKTQPANMQDSQQQIDQKESMFSDCDQILAESSRTEPNETSETQSPKKKRKHSVDPSDTKQLKLQDSPSKTDNLTLSALESATTNEELAAECSVPKNSTKLPKDSPKEEEVTYEKHDGMYQCSVCKFRCKLSRTMSRHMVKYHSQDKPFKCDVCEQTFRMKRYLTDHMRTHTGERPYPCDVCSASFNTPKNRSRHRLTHTDEKNHACELCGKCYNSVTTLSRHRLTHSKERPHRCQEAGCLYSTADKSLLRAHIKYKHSSERSLSVCEFCWKVFKTRSSLKCHIDGVHHKTLHSCPHCDYQAHFKSGVISHMKNIHGRDYKGSVSSPRLSQELFRCDHCDKTFKTKDSLRCHVLGVHERVTFSCPHCPYTANYKSSVLNHVKKNHSNNETATDTSPAQQFACDSCSKTFRTRDSLRCHVRGVHDKVSFFCPHCSYSSHYKAGLISHVKRIHRLTLNKQAATPSFRCDLCEFACFTNQELRRHTLNHRGEKPYKCPHCPFSTVDKLNLKFHLRTHTGEKPNECKICHRRFLRSVGLQRHLLTHTAEKPHHCEHCPATYADKKSLQTHCYIQHPHTRPYVCHLCPFTTGNKLMLSTHLSNVHGLKSVGGQVGAGGIEESESVVVEAVVVEGGDMVAMGTEQPVVETVVVDRGDMVAMGTEQPVVETVVVDGGDMVAMGTEQPVVETVVFDGGGVVLDGGQYETYTVLALDGDLTVAGNNSGLSQN